MTLKREDIKKLVIQEMLLEDNKWFTRLVNLMQTKNKSKPEQATKKPINFDQKLELVSDFITANRNHPEIKQSELGKLLFGGETTVNEQYENQLLSLMKQKKVDDGMLNNFINQMSAIPKFKNDLKTLGLFASEKPTTGDTQQTQASQTQAGQASTQPPLGVIDTSGGQPAQKQELNQAFLRDLGSKLIKFKNNKNKRQKQKILNQVIEDLKNMAKTEAEKDLESAQQSLQEILAEQIFNSLTGKNK